MDSVDILETGVPGLDDILAGGISRGSSVLITGPTGAGKTILATQVLILTLLTEASAKLIAHLGSLEYFDDSLLGDQVQVLNIQRMLQEKGLEASIAEILCTVMDVKVELLLIESVHSLYALVEDASAVQDFLFRLGSSLFQVGCTMIMVTDTAPVDGESSLEAVLSDMTLQLSVSLVGHRDERKLRVIKERGAAPLSGSHSYDIRASGIRVYPRIDARAVREEVPSGVGRLGWAVMALDTLTGGGSAPTTRR